MGFRLNKYIPLYWRSDRPNPIGPKHPETPVILFISGLSSTARESWNIWFDRASEDADFSTYRMDSFDYPTAFFAIPTLLRMPLVNELSKSLLSEITTKYPQSSAIIIIGHSLGGLVAKQAMIDEAKAGRGLSRYKLVLCGVPHAGAKVASLSSLLPWGQKHLIQLGKTSKYLINQAVEWARYDLERRIKPHYLVGGQDAVVDPSDACLEMSAASVTYLADLDHSTLIDAHKSGYASIKNFLRVRSSGLNPLFDIYSPDDEPFYLHRKGIDDRAESILSHSNMWLHGPSGSGKTTLIRHAAHRGGW